MSTLRQTYFESLKIKKSHVSDSDIRDLLILINRLNSYTELTLHFDDEILDAAKFDELFSRLQKGEMIQYILNKAMFLGNEFYVNENVLIPRQETEQLVTKTIELINKNFNAKITITDLCTGSGVIGISLANKFKNNRVICTDISDGAIEVLNTNKARFNAEIEILKGDIIKPLLERNIKSDVIVCNPPYIDKIDEIDERTWKYEPHLALLAFPNTKFYEEIIVNIDKLMNDHFLIALEIGEDMLDGLNRILKANNLLEYSKFEYDLYGKLRFLYIMK